MELKMHKINEEYLNNLYLAISAIENQDEAKRFLYDLFTYQELESMAQRVEVAILLREGKSYVDINQKTGVSTATICRVSKSLNYGEGGYSEILERLGK
jgi:TrpR-related protein YerC/YecD